MDIRFLLSLYLAVGLPFLPPAVSETQPDPLVFGSDAELMTSQIKKGFKLMFALKLDESTVEIFCEIGTVMGI